MKDNPQHAQEMMGQVAKKVPAEMKELEEKVKTLLAAK